MITKKGWASKFMISAYKKETAYDAGVTMSAANAYSMKGFSAEVDWDDKVVTDKDDITGTEEGTDQELVEQGLKIAYKETNAKPNSVIAMAGLVGGSITSTQDGALIAYKHKVVRVALGTAIPSIQAEALIGDLQYAFKGVKGSRFKLSGEASGMVSLEADLIGSGTRAISTTSFVAAVTESWLKMRDCKVWMESGNAISISPALVQAAEDISSGTPRALGVRLKSFSFEFDNAGEKQVGSGGGGVGQDYDYGRRKSALAINLLYNDSTELGDFINQNPLAVEFDLKGAGPIAQGGTLYYGVQLIIPRTKLKKAPWPKGAANDILTCDLDIEVFEDGTNPPFILEGYNAKAAYLVA
ncbi:MAG: phage tail tube protein [Candidatus Eisenbacteria bacterium]|nr:phage tail tube protein [Candidatus Eisenbacteria bacterium]